MKKTKILYTIGPPISSKAVQAFFLLTLLLTINGKIPRGAEASTTPNTLTLIPVADSVVSSLEPDRNYGDLGYLTVDYREHEYIYIYIMFNLSEIPSGLEIINASLQLYNIDRSRSGLNVSAHYCPDDTWNETEITWDSMPSFSFEPDRSVQISKTHIWYNWTLTDRVRDIIASEDKLLTEVLKLDVTPSDGVFMATFYSRDSPHGLDYGPRLTISFNKIPTSISCSVSHKVIPLLNQINIFGSIEPSPGAVEVTLTYTGPGGGSDVKTVISSPDGMFNDTFIPDRAGEWSVVANWSGNDFYEGTVSQVPSFTVVSAGPIVFFIGVAVISLVASSMIIKGRKTHRRR